MKTNKFFCFRIDIVSKKICVLISNEISIVQLNGHFMHANKSVQKKMGNKNNGQEK